MTTFALDGTGGVTQTDDSGALFESFRLREVTVTPYGTDQLFICGMASEAAGQQTGPLDLSVFTVSRNLFGPSPWSIDGHREEGRIVSSPCVTSGGPGQIVVAVQQEDFRLALISYTINGNAISRNAKFVSEVIGGGAGTTLLQIRSLASNPAVLVTAAGLSLGQLVLQAWHIDAAGGLTAHGTASAGAIKVLAFARAAADRLVTAVVDQGDQLAFIAWQVAPGTNGEFAITRVTSPGLADSHFGVIEFLSLAPGFPLAAQGETMVVNVCAVRVGVLKLISCYDTVDDVVYG